MPLEAPITPGTVDWTGENPGILLKEREDGPFSAMALFFRVAWSPVGQGHVLLLYEQPDVAAGLPRAHNVVMSDNERLTAFLLDTFVAHLPAFRGAAAFGALSHLPVRAVRQAGDPMGHRYSETVAGHGLAVELVWEGLEPPRALELPPELTGTKRHTMFSLLVPARAARIYVNGRALPGRPARRAQAGLETTSAFLYFSETWILPARTR